MTIKIISTLMLFLCLSNSSCAKDKDNETMDTDTEKPINTTEKASVVSVSVSGDVNNYSFSVGVSSPDTGCNQYANWWEVITEDGELVYRRILGHSHVNEQPFVRSGGAVQISADQTVYVRAHMNTSGYGTTVYKGTVSSGFMADTLAADFANDLESLSPQPSGCAF